MDTEPANHADQAPEYGARIKTFQAKIADLDAKPAWYQEFMGLHNFDRACHACTKELESLRDAQRQAKPIAEQIEGATRWLKTCDKNHQKKTMQYEQKLKERQDFLEAHRLALRERDAELADLDAAVREAASKLAKAREDHARVCSAASGLTPQHSDTHPAVRAGRVIVSIDMAGQIQGTLDKISASFPP